MGGEQPSIAQPRHCSYASANGFGRYGKLIITGLINPEDYEAAEKKAEQLAPDSSPGFAHHPKMGAYSYTPLSGFEPPSDIKPGPEPGPEGDPAGPIAVNTCAVEPLGTSSKSTSDPCSGCTSPFVAGVAGKPRIQRPREFAVAATKDKAKDKEPRTAPSYLPVRQELPFDSDSKGASATIASVRKHPPPRTNHQPMIAHYRIDKRNGHWNISRPMEMRCDSPRSPSGALRMTTLQETSSVLARLQAFPKIRC
jgi:hypothetical protein